MKYEPSVNQYLIVNFLIEKTCPRGRTRFNKQLTKLLLLNKILFHSNFIL
jgi:hypothetical protein